MFFIVIVQKEEFMKKEYIRIKLKLNLNLLIVKKNDRKLNFNIIFPISIYISILFPNRKKLIKMKQINQE